MQYQKDDFLEFSKGIAAVAVVLLHSLPNYYIFSIYWLGQAVPIFIIISSILLSGKIRRLNYCLRDYFSIKNFRKVLRRIIIPFVVIELILLILLVIKKGSWEAGIKNFGIGLGPGAYYPFIYIQIWFLIPFFVLLIDKYSKWTTLFSGLLLCISMEVYFSYIEIQANFYSISVFRYLWIIFLCSAFNMEQLIKNKIFQCFVAIGAIFIYCEIYLKINFTPLFINQWLGYHWITAGYSIYFYFIVKIIWRIIESKKVSRCLISLGKYSYEIFLWQMFVYTIGRSNWYLLSISNGLVSLVLYIILTALISIFPFFIWIRLKKGESETI